MLIICMKVFDENLKKCLHNINYDNVRDRLKQLLGVCDSLTYTANLLYEIYIDYNEDNPNNGPENLIRLGIYEKLFDFVNYEMNPSFDDIDDMLLVCRILLEANRKLEYEKFIMRCPQKFIITYSNNSEKTPILLGELDERKMLNVKSYILAHKY